MIDLFFPAGPQAYRHGRLVTPLGGTRPERPKGRDPVKAAARRARYRARMRADPARHEKHVQACREWHKANHERSLAMARAWKAAHRISPPNRSGG